MTAMTQAKLDVVPLTQHIGAEIRGLDLREKPDDATATAEALKFFSWAYAKGDAAAAELDYVAMPDSVVTSVEETWAKEIVGADGKPLFPATN